MTWETAKLGEVCKIEKGNIGIMKAVAGEFPLVVLGEERKSHNEYQFDDEAVIIPLVSSTGHGHASMKRIFFQSGKFSVGSILCAVIPKDKSKLSAEFLYRYLDFNKEKELVGRMKGMANVSLPIKEIATVEIPLPPLEHQKKLIEEFQKLETSNNQITTELSHQLELVRQLRQAFLREAMQGKLVPQDTADESAEILLGKIKAEKEKLVAEKKIKKDKPLPEIKVEEIPFEIPNNWTWCRLGELTSLITKGSSPKWQGIQYLESSNKGILFITSKNVGSYNLLMNDKDYVEERFNEIEPRSILKKGDLLTNIVGASIGRTALYDIDDIANINQAVCLMRFEHNFVDKMFLLHYLNSSLSTEQMFEKQFAPGRANLSMGDIANFYVPLPPLAEQKRIVEKLEKLMKYCDELEANIRESKQNAESLLQVALKEALEPK